jgi:hypothetical protein
VCFESGVLDPAWLDIHSLGNVLAVTAQRAVAALLAAALIAFSTGRGSAASEKKTPFVK